MKRHCRAGWPFAFDPPFQRSQPGAARGIAAACAAAMLLCSGSAIAAPEPGAAYGEHMVLQRGQPIVIAGTAAPGGTVFGQLGNTEAEGRADDDGRFTLTFPAREATAEPIALTLRDSDGSARFGDILVGDVYLCSGQSNMELPVERALDVSAQLGRAGDDAMRLLKVPLDTASVPQDRFGEPVSWKGASSESVADFSAACFYMGKKLRGDRPDVPVGLIHSNWGGSQARPWLSPESGIALYGAEEMDLLQLYDTDPLAATAAFVPRWYDWWREKDGGREPWRDPATLDWQAVPRVSFWNEWDGTGLDDQPLANVWLRNEFTLSAEQAAQGGELSIGSIDDLDLTWVNGTPVGYTFGWGVERHYRIPAELLHEGRNEVLIAANNSWDTGGFFSTADRLYFDPDVAGNAGEPIPLGQGWQFSTATVDGVPPRAPWDVNAGIGVMHNRMIAPLGPMRLAGVAWYQGESDVDLPGYGDKLRELFAGWRRQFGDQARMLMVQLAAFGDRQSTPAKSGWAALRQTQLESVTADANADLVTAIDIGEPGDIHPANKNELGRRLALAAEGEPMPMPAAARIAGDTITVSFTGVEGDLRAYGGPYPLGMELCGDDDASCRFVVPSLAGDTMVIQTDGQPATRVRHAWADAPIVNLYDARDLPVPGFQLSIER